MLHRVRRHLVCAMMARRAVSDADLVAAPDGRIIHAPRDATPELRALLALAARAHDAERRGREAEPDAERVWEELWAGGWALVDTIDTDGKRLLLLRREPGVPHALSPRERQALELLARGASHKRIALELGVASSTESEIATRALEKLGFRSRMEFLRAVRPRSTATALPAADDQSSFGGT
jgi:DNA-binding CsgD family transcriptional regulator